MLRGAGRKEETISSLLLKTGERKKPLPYPGFSGSEADGDIGFHSEGVRLVPPEIPAAKRRAGSDVYRELICPGGSLRLTVLNRL